MQKYRGSVHRSTGAAVPGATVTVTLPGGAAATIYSDNGVTQLPTNVVTTDSSGEYEFYAHNGRYNLLVQGSNFLSETVLDALLYDPVDPDAYLMPRPGTAASNSAELLLALQSGASVIEFREGEYLFMSSVSHSVVGRTIRGQGANRTTLKLANGHDVDYLFNSTAGASGAIFEDLTFDGNCANSVNLFCGLLKADHSTITNKLALRDCKFTNIRLFLLRLFPNSTDFLMERCRVEEIEDWMIEATPWLRGVIRDCVFFNYSKLPTYSSATGCVLVLYGGSDSWIIEGNQFYPHATNGYFAIESVWSGTTAVRGMVFANNVLDARNALNGNNSGTGVSGAFEGCSFSGNTWRNGAGSIHTCGLEVVGRRNTISGNTCHNGQFAVGSNTGVSGGDSSGTVVVGNTFVQNRTAAYPAGRQSDCIRLGDAVGVIVEGNSFYYEQGHISGGSGVNMESASAASITIRNNSFSSYDKWSVTVSGVKLDTTGASSKIIIEGNLFEKLYRGINLELTSATGVHVKRNYFSDCDLNINESGGASTQADNVTL